MPNSSRQIGGCRHATDEYERLAVEAQYEEDREIMEVLRSLQSHGEAEEPEAEYETEDTDVGIPKRSSSDASSEEVYRDSDSDFEEIAPVKRRKILIIN